jgi:hypothetical protein
LVFFAPRLLGREKGPPPPSPSPILPRKRERERAGIRNL